MSNLIPQKRPDKNGRMVTRHVKPPVSPTSAVGSLPAPAVINPMMFGAGTVTIPSKVTGLKDIWDNNRISRTKYTMDDFDASAVKEINQLIEQGQALGRSFGLSHAVGKALDLMVSDEIRSGLHNVAVFGGYVLKHGNNDVTDYITALHEMNAPKEIDYLLDATDEERRAAQALVEFTVRAELELGGPVIRYSSEDPEEIMEFTELRDSELTSFILQNPDSADEVLDILVQEKGPVPVDVIKERLQHSEKALRGGVL